MESHKAPDIGHCLRDGWALYQREPFLLSGAAIIGAVISAIASYIPFAHVAVHGPLLGGLYVLIMRIDRDQPAGIGNYFDAFSQFLPLLLATVVMSILISIGLIALVLPGLYLALAYAFTILNIVDRKMDFWPAMEASRKAVTAHFWQYLVLSLLFLLICFAGALAFGIGLLVAIPVCLAAQYCFYRELGDGPTGGD